MNTSSSITSGVVKDAVPHPAIEINDSIIDGPSQLINIKLEKLSQLKKLSLKIYENKNICLIPNKFNTELRNVLLDSTTTNCLLPLRRSMIEHRTDTIESLLIQVDENGDRFAICSFCFGYTNVCSRAIR